MRRLAAVCVALTSACSGADDIVAKPGPDAGTSYDPAHPPAVLGLTGDLDVRDPSVLESAGVFYLFQTGTGIQTKTSGDLLNWQSGPSVFATNPSWIAIQVPAATELWAPSVAAFGGQFHLYYAASTFGSARSCIGHATSTTLGAAAAWNDQGALVCSNTGSSVDDWNAIDPSVFSESDGTHWLVFGSFSSGIKLIQLDATGARADDQLIPLAARPNDGDAIQAATLVARGGQHYLFSSFDFCCRGVDSTHRIMVGRSSSLFGPYVDAAGAMLLDGGGSQVLAGDTRWRGPGSNAVVFHAGHAYNVYHAYDADNAGNPTLRIAELVWDASGWPVSGGP